MKLYHQKCGVAKALDLVGERWTLLLVRDLLLGGRRYTDLLRGLPGLTTNLLAKRLKDLESNGIISRRALPPPAASIVYELTALGRELEPVVLALGTFGARWIATGGPDDRSDLRWLLVSLRRRYQGDGEPLQISIIADGLPYGIEVGPGGLHTHDGECVGPNAVIHATGQAVLAMFARGLPAAQVGARIEGDAGAVSRLQRSLDSISGAES